MVDDATRLRQVVEDQDNRIAEAQAADQVLRIGNSTRPPKYRPRRLFRRPVRTALYGLIAMP